MLAIFDTQINSIELELTALLAKVEEHRQQLKATKVRQRKTTKLIDGLKGLINELPSDAYANLRDSILSLFPSPQLPMTNDSSGNDSPATEPLEKLPIIEAIKEIEQVKPLTAAGKLDQQQEQQPSQGQSEKPASDIPIASSPDQLQNAFSLVPPTNTPDFIEEVQPEVSNARATAEVKSEPSATAINEFCSFVYLNPTVGYIRANRGQMAGEIMSAYLGTSTKKLASEWAELITLWGGRTEIRKPERLQESAVKYEIKIWDLSQKRINFLASHHIDPSSPVPSFPSEFSKKKPQILDENAEKSRDGGGETTLPIRSNLTVKESSEKPENGNLETQESKFYFTNARDYDPLTPAFLCHLKEGNKYVGKVSEALTLDPAHDGRWRHDALRGIEWQTVSFESREAAAEDLLKRKQYAENIHQKVNNDVRKMYGFDEIEKAEAATEDALKKDAIERIDGYMQQLGWSKKQTKEFLIARFGIDHRSKMDLLQLLELAEAMKEQLNQPA